MATRAQPDVVIRAAQATDLDDIAAIERAVFNDPWSRRSFADLVEARSVVFLVAEAELRSVVGYAVVLVAGVESELANFAVARLLQKQGLGRRLLAEVLEIARKLGCREMFLEVRESNRAAVSLYESAGFQSIGRRVRYYARPIEDAIVMRTGLKPES